mmetsp:Transcript_43524/g.132453  ORF Transcript_43524/g.132453 Transcript_43524/m.132453 type:complete len:279 (-) Transcript_43524:175-1011(-)
MDSASAIPRMKALRNPPPPGEAAAAATPGCCRRSGIDDLLLGTDDLLLWGILRSSGKGHSRPSRTRGNIAERSIPAPLSSEEELTPLGAEAAGMDRRRAASAALAQFGVAAGRDRRRTTRRATPIVLVVDGGGDDSPEQDDDSPRASSASLCPSASALLLAPLERFDDNRAMASAAGRGDGAVVGSRDLLRSCSDSTDSTTANFCVLRLFRSILHQLRCAAAFMMRVSPLLYQTSAGSKSSSRERKVTLVVSLNWTRWRRVGDFSSKGGREGGDPFAF